MGREFGLMNCLSSKFCSWLTIFLCLCYYSYGADPYNSTERDALLNLKNSLLNNTVLRENWRGPQCLGNKSQWRGITCKDGRVTGLQVEEMGLQGSIKENALLNLTELKAISFRENGLSGFLPSLSALSKLQFIDFSHNKFSGPMPEYSSAPWRQLKLHFNRLNGSIPISILNSSLLETLQVQINSLSGTIPPFNQSTLQIFNVSNNNLTGSIPNTPIMQSFNGNSFLGNPGLCGKPLNNLCPNETTPAPSPSPSPSPAPSPTGKDHKKSRYEKGDFFITVIVVSAFVFVLLVALFLCCCYRMMKAKKAASKGSPQIKKNVEITETFQSSSSGTEAEPKNKGKMVFTSRLEPPGFDIDDLFRASAELLGRGNFGSTYKAELETGESLVVKRLKDLTVLTKKEFDQQMKLLSKLQHSNLVTIAAYYFAKEDKLIVYEYMPNGSLFDRLHGTRGPGRMPLNWKSRLKIAQGVAQGMAYLHIQCPQQKTPHGNLKSSNVLLDQDLNPALTDYGLAPLLSPQLASLRLMAYKAPEYLHTKKVSLKSDVWCFGVLLLELLTGKMYSTIGSPGVDLPEWVSSVYTNINWTSEIFDLEILGDKDSLPQMVEMLDIALTCVDEVSNKRPKMSEVLKTVEAIKEIDKEEEVQENILSGGEASSSSHSIRSVASSTV